MTSQLGLRTTSVLDVVFGAQACFLLGNAVYTISKPSAASGLAESPFNGVPDHTVQAMGVTSLSTGVLFGIATYQRNMPIILASLPGRLFAAVIFYRNGGGWKKVAFFETFVASITGVAILWNCYA